MFEGFTRTEIATSGARIHLRHGGEGPPLLLLHGKAPLRNPSPLEGAVYVLKNNAIAAI